jgi:hypothetical protein
MKFGPDEMAQLMETTKALITVTMLASVGIGLVVGVIVAICVALFRRLRRDRAEPRLTKDSSSGPKHVYPGGSLDQREHTSIRNDIIPDGRITGSGKRIFSFRLLILYLIVAVSGGGILYWHYVSQRSDTLQRPDLPPRADTLPRPDLPPRADTLPRPDLPLEEAYKEVYSLLGASSLPGASRPPQFASHLSSSVANAATNRQFSTWQRLYKRLAIDGWRQMWM